MIGYMGYAPASLPLTAPPRRLLVGTGPLEGARPSVLRLTVWVDVFSTTFTGAAGVSSSVLLPTTGKVSYEAPLHIFPGLVGPGFARAMRRERDQPRTSKRFCKMAQRVSYSIR